MSKDRKQPEDYTKYIRAYVKLPNQTPYEWWIRNELETLQQIVRGYIETVTIAEDMVIICNEEGRLKGLPVNCKVCGVEFVGPVVFIGVDGEKFSNAPVDLKTFRTLFPDLWKEEN